MDVRVNQLPEFVEDEAEDFFIQFEKVASLKGWDKIEWALLVQTKFKGKARESYACLDLVESVDYEVVKETVLSNIQLDPEVYRQRFRGLKKVFEQTHLELAR